MSERLAADRRYLLTKRCFRRMIKPSASFSVEVFLMRKFLLLENIVAIASGGKERAMSQERSGLAPAGDNDIVRQADCDLAGRGG